MKISQRAFDMIVAEEVTSKPYYIQHYQFPEWPGLSSGVTVGIGYDLGTASREKIASDWASLVLPDMLTIMMSCSGLTGNAGRIKCAEVKKAILISWEMAMTVFASRDVPQWTAAVLKAIPGAENLNGDLLGVLVDIAYNRELKAIRFEVGQNRLASVPREISRMKRLWPGTLGLLRRCDHRIALWNYGMTQPQGPSGPALAMVADTPIRLDQEVPLNPGPARTKPPESSTAQNTTTSAIAIGGVALAITQSGLTASLITAAAALSLAAAVWFIWYHFRNPKPDFPIEVLGS
jgi:hypothetical protein